jgi:hypothetical protein
MLLPWASRRRFIAFSIIALTHLSRVFTIVTMSGWSILVDQAKGEVVIVEYAMRYYRRFGIWTRKLLLTRPEGIAVLDALIGLVRF